METGLMRLLRRMMVACIWGPALLSLAGGVLAAEGAPPAPETPEGYWRQANDGGAQYRMQLLQQEMMQLRGQVEELSYRLDRMQQSQDQRYMDLDRRLQALTQGGALPASGDAAAPAASAAGSARASSAPGSASAEGGEDEQTLYDTALQLIRLRQYDPAIIRLEKLIEEYPEGALTANAYYWLGEVHAAKPVPDYEQARQALVQVITYYPDHRKTADAGFKLGKVYYQLGDCARAADILRQVVTRFGDRTVARLAEDYLNSLECDS